MKIADIIDSNWNDYITDLTPKDRRMDILRKHNVSGMSTENVRLLFNEIVKNYAQNGLYLEVGVLHGCSLLSAALFNESTKCIGIDNFSIFNTNQENETILKANLEKFNLKNASYIHGDYVNEIPQLFNTIDQKIDVYFYDGKHSYEHQVKGLQIVLPYLNEECVIIIDDANLIDVENANNDFLKQNPEFQTAFKIKTKGNRSPDWWNGVEVITRGI